MGHPPKLTSSDGADGDTFGISASINGRTIAVGAWEADGQRGEAYVFVEPPNGWTNTTETAKLTASDGAISDALGVSISVSSDTVAVGAFGHLSESGTAYVYVKPPSGWVNMTETAEIKNTKQGICLGSSVSLDGQLLLVGGDCFQNFRGGAFVFLQPPTGWHDTSSYKAKLSIPFSFQGDLFGYSSALQGKTAVIGAVNAPTFPPCGFNDCDHGPGEAFIFTTQ
jgi:hypothetical protein